jgi:hypothetical protein
MDNPTGQGSFISLNDALGDARECLLAKQMRRQEGGAAQPSTASILNTVIDASRACRQFLIG